MSDALSIGDGQQPAEAPGPILQSAVIGFRIVYVVTLLLGVLWLGSNCRVISSDTQAVVTEYGRVVRTQKAGLLLAWPRPIEAVRLLPGPDRQLSRSVAALPPVAGIASSTGVNGNTVPAGATPYLTGDGKVVLLSGGASDIGRATALRLATEGAAVVVGDVTLEGAEAVAEEVAAAGGQALGLRCDVRREDSVSAFVERAVAAFGGVDCIDHNVAWSHPRLDTDAVGVDLGVWDRVIETTTRGALLLARHAIPAMVARGGGSIVTISSGTSTIGESTRVAYGVSKAALNQLTRHLAVRYARDGIRANAIAPGFILTETAAAQVPAAVQARLAEANPTRRLGTPDDIARVVVFLCSDAAAYVNGQVLHVDGGHQIAGMM